MSKSSQVQSGRQLLISLAALVIVGAGLKLAAPILIPITLAAFLCVVALALVERLVRAGIPQGLSAALTLVLVIVSFVGVLLSFISLGNRLAQELPSYAPRLESMGLPVSEFLEGEIGSLHTQKWIRDVGPTQALKTVSALAAQFSKSISVVLLVIILTSFFLFEALSLKKRASTVFGNSPTIERLGSVVLEIQRYLAIKTLTSAMTGVIIACWTAVMGVPFALLWGLIGFVLNYIPVVGSFVAAIPALLVCLALSGIEFTLIVGVGYLFINVGISNVVEPVLMGNRLGLSPTAVFLSLVIWGYLWGPAGMLLSVPLTMVALIALENIEGMEWLPALVTTKRRSLHSSA